MKRDSFHFAVIPDSVELIGTSSLRLALSAKQKSIKQEKQARIIYNLRVKWEVDRLVYKFIASVPMKLSVEWRMVYFEHEMDEKTTSQPTTDI